MHIKDFERAEKLLIHRSIVQQRINAMTQIINDFKEIGKEPTIKTFNGSITFKSFGPMKEKEEKFVINEDEYEKFSTLSQDDAVRITRFTIALLNKKKRHIEDQLKEI